MKVQNLSHSTPNSELIGMNPPFEQETYVELVIFISGITGQELADKENTEKYIIAKLSENLNVSHTQVTEFDATNNHEPYDMTMKLNISMVKDNIDRFQMGKVKDFEFEMLKILHANIINLS
ncbi:hypothetical protein [uncultured Draconibacterium sp.]|uniref:hypothetical protein n=1 Tax=uncultured Draconibacterium sp. TaxID=1573823 RepID=UPI00321650E3